MNDQELNEKLRQVRLRPAKPVPQLPEPRGRRARIRYVVKVNMRGDSIEPQTFVVLLVKLKKKELPDYSREYGSTKLCHDVWRVGQLGFRESWESVLKLLGAIDATDVEFI